MANNKYSGVPSLHLELMLEAMESLSTKLTGNSIPPAKPALHSESFNRGCRNVEETVRQGYGDSFRHTLVLMGDDPELFFRPRITDAIHRYKEVCLLYHEIKAEIDARAEIQEAEDPYGDQAILEKENAD